LKRCFRLLSILLFAGLPLWAQDAVQPTDALPASTGHRVPNVTGFAFVSKSTPMELGNYPFRIFPRVRNHWYPQLATLEKSANWKQGTTVIEFQINRDGSLAEMRTLESAGDASLDSAASQAISSAAPFPMLPQTYPGQTLQLRYYFGYDQPVGPEAPLCNGPNLGAQPADYVVRTVGNGVAAPHPTFSPDPEYSDVARRMKYQSRVRIAGTVDTEGAFTDLCVLVPGGGGLDEKAMAAVRKWRFEPATLVGAPVAVRISVEVDFRLY
jgi:TonB family protein